MARRHDTMQVGDEAEDEAARLLTERGWTVTNLNAERRNHKLYDLKATRDGHEIMVSVKHARAKRQVRLGNPNIFRELNDNDFVIVFLPPTGSEESSIEKGRYDLWVVPGRARHVPLKAHIHYYGSEQAAFAQTSMMIKDKIDTVGGRSISGTAFREWQRYRNAWHLLPA